MAEQEEITVAASADVVIDHSTSFNVPLLGTKKSIDNMSDDEVRVQLKNHIDTKTRLIRDKLQYVSLKYDIVKNKFNHYSLNILVVSALITLSDALKLLITKYISDNQLNIDGEQIDLILNILSLLMGTYMTIVASVIRFRNYREKMEKLREMQDKFIHIKAQYCRELSIINLNKNEQKSLLEEVQDKLTEYDQIVNEVNIISEITNEEMVEFSKKISNFKVSISTIKVNEEKRIQEITVHNTNNNSDD